MTLRRIGRAALPDPREGEQSLLRPGLVGGLLGCSVEQLVQFRVGVGEQAKTPHLLRRKPVDEPVQLLKVAGRGHEMSLVRIRGGIARSKRR